jgi:uncharacterized protein YjiS (DUF1127 family)
MTCHTQALNSQALSAGHHGLAGLGQRLSDTGKGLWRAYWRRRSERATIALLHALQDNVLHDIGIDRSEIESVVRTRSRGRLLRFESV